MRILLILGLLSSLISTYAKADEYILRFGGMLNQPTLVQNKLVSLAYSGPISTIFDYQIEGGWFVDNNVNKKTLFISPTVGFNTTSGSLYLGIFFGPSLVSNTDSYLSTPYEFHTNFEVGFRDPKKGTDIGVGFKHMSNAGIVGPNLGRDFLYIKIGW